MTPLPTTTISGYLGAGKTTLVNRLLAAPHGSAILVLVNDFGAVALDETLIAAREGDLIALANGCMCCQIGGQLYDAVDRILRMRADGRRIDHLAIETSGVADPARIADIAVAEPELEACHTLVLVDALNFPTLMQDRRLADTLVRQLEGATLVALSKTDLVDGQAVAELALTIEGMAPGVPLVRDAAHLPHELLLDADLVPRAGGAKALRPHAPGGLFASWSWEGDTYPHAALEAFVRDDSLAAWRIKGVVRTESGLFAVQRAGLQVEMTPAAATPTPGPSTPARSRIVAIGAQPGFSPARCETLWRNGR